MAAAAPAVEDERSCFQVENQVYYGEVIEGPDKVPLRHGRGDQLEIAKTVSGETLLLGRYEGVWNMGKMSGSATYHGNDGSVYEGLFLDGKRHGCGTLTWVDGSWYDGMWADGEMTGQGRYRSTFDGISTEGIFHRGCAGRNDGTWLDVQRQHEEQRAAWVRGEHTWQPPALFPITRCTPADFAGHFDGALSQNLVPFVVEEAADPKTPTGLALRCLEAGELGCTDATAVHIAYAASERRRHRDHPQIFRDALRQALLTYRRFVVVFGKRGDGKEPLPPEWRLSTFFDPASLPSDLFDLRHFHASNGVEPFLPFSLGKAPSAPVDATRAPRAEVRPPSPAPKVDGSQPKPEAATAKAPTAAKAVKKKGEKVAAVEAETPVQEEKPPPPKPDLRRELPTVYRLRPALATLDRIAPGLDDEGVREELAHFAEHVPMHRVAAILVSAPDEAA